MRRASNRNVMAWTFMGNTRMHQVLREKGNKLSHVGIFTFEVSADGTISETGTAVSTILPYVKKWPHIKWLLTIMNHGTASIFTALRENTDDAQDTFISEIVRIIDKYPWCSGIDIDLERGGELANRAKANALFSRIYSTVKAKGASLHVNICLPGMTSVGGSVGGENWCVYADLDAYCDTAAIMSYGMSWAGSAPGPVSPRSWLEGIYSYAANAMNPDKIMMGLPGYGWRWQIYDTTENLGTTYRGTSLTYYAAKYWMEGLYNHTGDAPPQPFIPFFSYWDWTDMVPWGLLHVYDFMEGWDTSRETAEPTKHETYSGRKYLTTYLKQQKVSFGAISVDRNGVPDSYSGNAVIGEGYASWSGRYEVMGQYAGSDIVLESNSLLRAVFFIPKNKERQVTVMRQAVTTMQYVFAGIGGFMGWFLGGLDGFLYALLMFVVIDYATGLMAAFVQKKVSSEVGFKGICKKVAIFCLVGIGHVLDTQVIQNGSVLRTAVIFFYLSNEGISIIENVALIGLPVPKKLKEVLEQLHEEADEKKEDE